MATSTYTLAVSFEPFLSLPPLARDALCAGACAGGAGAWVGIWTGLASSGAVESKLSRKMIHVGSAPLFVLVWPLFSAEPTARLFAAIVPTLNAARILLSARAPEGEAALVTAISRSGRREEVLSGPLYYVLVLFLATACAWRSSVVGVIALAQMAVGDGLADIVGRRLGGTGKWPFAPSKSIAGTTAFVLGAFGASVGLIGWLHLFGCLATSPQDAAGRALAISLSCAAVELLPSSVVDDNISVPLLGALLAALLF